MINNRQAGRRRGRGGQRPPNNPGRPEQGNRIDNRARGNASQLHEKYKTLARDSQLQGDRVNTEYYLQFADHYFRVLSESRSRSDDNGQQRRPQNDAANDYDDDGDDNRAEADDQRGDDRQPRQRDRDDQRHEARDDRPTANGRDDRDERDDRSERNDRNERSDRDGGEERQPRRARPRRPQADEAAPDAPSIEPDRLPPALAPEADRLNGSDDEPAPRRARARRPRLQEGDAGGVVQS